MIALLVLNISSVMAAEVNFEKVDTINLLHEKAPWNGRIAYGSYPQFHELKNYFSRIVKRNEIIDIDDTTHKYRFELVEGDNFMEVSLGEFYFLYNNKYYLLDGDEFLEIKKLLSNRLKFIEGKNSNK